MEFKEEPAEQGQSNAEEPAEKAEKAGQQWSAELIN